MTNELNVVGEHRDDEQHLLVVGDDGRHYDYWVARNELSPVEPDERWMLDSPPADPVEGAPATAPPVI